MTTEKKEQSVSEAFDAVRISPSMWLINGRLIPAVSGGAGETPDEKAKREAEEADQKRVDEINGIVKSHMKRLQKDIVAEVSKSLGEQVAELVKAAAPAPPKDDDDKTGKKGKGEEKDDPKLKLALEEIEKLKKSSADAQAKAEAAEKKSRTDATRGSLREGLDALGVKGAKAAALISHFEASGMIRYNDEGAALFVSSRSRSKGAKAEELEFDDLREGLADWAKTSEAAEFLPAPGAATTTTGGKKPAAPVTRTAPRTDRDQSVPITSEDELAARAADHFAKRGIDLTTALKP